MDLRVVVERDQTRTVMHLSGDVDLTSAPELRRRIEEELTAPSPHLRLNLSRVTFMDADGIEVLLDSRRRALLLDGSMTLVTPSGMVRRVLDITGFLGAFDVVDVPAQRLRGGASARARRYSWRHGRAEQRERGELRIIRDGP